MTIWTPSGEHEVPREAGDASGAAESAPRTAPPNQPAGEAGDRPEGQPTGQPEMDPQMQQQMEQQLAEIRERILQTPIEAMLAQHFVGLYEIAAIHMSAESPNLHSARLAINAMDGILSATEGELGDAEESMQSMLHQLRLAYVSASQDSGEPGDAADPAAAEPESPASDT